MSSISKPVYQVWVQHSALETWQRKKQRKAGSFTRLIGWMMKPMNKQFNGCSLFAEMNMIRVTSGIEPIMSGSLSPKK